MTKLRLSCQEVSRLLSDGQDRQLAAPDRARLRFHLVMCNACREVEQQLDLLRMALRRMGREAGRLPPNAADGDAGSGPDSGLPPEPPSGSSR